MQERIVYIDAQNVTIGMRSQGYEIDWGSFYHYLLIKYHVHRVKIFLGYIPENTAFYEYLYHIGYEVLFRETHIINGIRKGNIDSLLVLIAVSDYFQRRCSEVILVSGDGDFDVLVKFLLARDALQKLLCPNVAYASKLLKKATPRNKIQDMFSLLHIITKKIL